ncbi:DUF790 family protein [Dictyobacter formicarum]|uniref:DUF790 domain-containing protein n=1 Tax=Dictyobacter formicarum TaxID=2778368 RepID=A0ABQ3VE45_9CHLR|nr:DUF790 family protein [Dictyobacter formicarum]GHO83933.1 hypothetical protein KSZ_19390 [Dictyobacter formicarum]
MLTSDLIRPLLRFQDRNVSVALVDPQDDSLRATAQELIELFLSHLNRSQEAWERALTAYIGPRLDYVLVRGLAKVLSDGATFTPLQATHTPTVVRETMFAYGPVFSGSDMLHPVSRQSVLQSVAADLQLSTNDVESLLFADRHASYLLTDAGPAWTPEALLTRYNLELARGVLYWASQLTIEIADNYKDIWKFIKLFKLMFVAQASASGGYRIELDGPISPFVGATLRYGRQMAAFLPALFLCQQWKMQATVYPPQGRGAMNYQLDSTSDDLQSHFKRSGTFDSRLEADFAHEFEQKIGQRRGKWLLQRESDLLVLGDTVMVPDFVMVDRRNEQRRILIELVGFWHPDYLRRKLEKVRAANCSHLLLLIYKGLNVTEEDFQGITSEVLFFPNKPVMKDVLAKVEEMSQRIYGPAST